MLQDVLLSLSTRLMRQFRNTHRNLAQPHLFQLSTIHFNTVYMNSRWPCIFKHHIIHSFIQQGLEHMPWIHRSLKAYCATLQPPLCFRCSHFRRQVSPRPLDARDPSSERWHSSTSHPKEGVLRIFRP